MATRNNGPETGRTRSGRFTAGNPGRPKGARHKATVAAMALLDGQAQALTQRAVELALAGDTTALRLCIERLLPTRKDAPITFTMPAMQSAGDAAKAAGAVVEAVAAGELTPAEGAAVMGLMDAFRKALETSELESRLAALEARQ
jgi:hypothetical protein